MSGEGFYFLSKVFDHKQVKKDQVNLMIKLLDIKTKFLSTLYVKINLHI